MKPVFLFDSSVGKFFKRDIDFSKPTHATLRTNDKGGTVDVVSYEWLLTECTFWQWLKYKMSL